MNKALFLDRDGIINVDHGYVVRIEDFSFVEGIFDLCVTAQSKGYLLIVVTNQSGIERGLFKESEFQVLTTYMCMQFDAQGIKITDVYYCPFLSDHPNRKPNPGMFIQAGKKHNLDFASSIAIGDKESDIIAAQCALVGKTILFSSIPIKSKASYVVGSISAIKDIL